MELSKITYDVSRCYLQDRKSKLPADCWNTLHGWIRARDFQRLASCTSHFTLDVTCVEGVRTLHQIEAFFKKNASFAVNLHTRLAAIIAFDEGEQICEETNARLDDYYCSSRVYQTSLPSDDFDLPIKIRRAQQYIEKVLGPFPDFLRVIPELIQVTSGATATRSRRKAFPHLKISRRTVCTPGALPYLASLSEFFGYETFRAKLITSNRVAFVPKSWKTERTIACEAEGNMCLQLAFDKYAKRRLRRFGINLSDQTRNQELAKEGSINGKLSTIDLSMASDTLAYNTVALLLPGEWFQYLRSIRSEGYALYPNQDEKYHKFSSMGNGATFSLETLVFAALCSAVGSSAFSVYGDDIIIESELASDLIALLGFFGFVPNTEKSYTTGSFRESCGKSWYKGFDVTPRYIRDVDSRKATLCHVINCMMEISEPFGALEEYVHGLVREHKLPLVPYNEDSMSGVWIHPHFAYEKKLIVTPTRGKHAWIPRFKAYKPLARVNRVYDYRAYVLWFLRNWSRRSTEASDEATRYTTSSHKYVRKWVHWRPVVGAPENLYWYSENLIHRVS